MCVTALCKCTVNMVNEYTMNIYHKHTSFYLALIVIHYFLLTTVASKIKGLEICNRKLYVS